MAHDTVTYVPGRDIAELLAPRPRVQDLPGFHEDYADFVDYIIKCTHRIWEEKQVGLIYSHYTHNCLVHTLGGQTFGAEEVVQNTIRTIAAFPDRSLYGDHVIWSGDAAQGFYSSHRITSLMTNQGASEFGPATGKRVRVTTIADCAVRENRIYEEWLVRDNSWLVRQLGLDPAEVARRQAEAAPAPSHEQWRLGEIDRVLGQLAPARGEFPADPMAEPEAFALALFQEVWNARMFGEVRRHYAGNARMEAPNGRRLFGHGEIIGWVIAVLAALPDARLSVDHVAAVPHPSGDGVDIAIRWQLAGTHRGGGLYGPATGRRLLILGVTHWTLRGGRIENEWTIFDEVAIWRQIFGGPAA
ncbi:ester cyclase [Niveispirillum cyanobacteriorum]|uniref:Uncharacterized protein n=1 Tax=Niveispirillum cyanobacteriorum TaxID=1612173 RepID=A0A2K9NFH1_9PROT|nr:ester cyclase [Niveispirillum cyanobacteriorum]AUN31870.1 hypothetical protein C0V82_13665 [Niveispirillum cyanobacteriorum]GGE88626.1 hypothetical protein GCM10011317_52080 [Niveispirillum cyanobacteriorum]